VVNEIPDGCFVVFELFREGQSLTDQAGDTLTKRVVEALDVAGFAAFLADSFVAFGGQNQSVGIPEVCMDDGALPINRWQGIPQLLSRFCRPVPHGATHNFASVFVLGQPDPDLLHLGAHK